MTPRRLPRLCYYTDDGTLAGESWHMQETALEPRPDGTFHGTLTTTVETDECDDKGNTAVTPLVATRVSDVPPGITRPPA